MTANSAPVRFPTSLEEIDQAELLLVLICGVRAADISSQTREAILAYVTRTLGQAAGALARSQRAAGERGRGGEVVSIKRE